MKEYGGMVTPAQQEAWLDRHARIEKVTRENGIKVKYYTMGKDGFKAICYNDIAVQIQKFSAKEIKTMVSCANLKFGGF